MTYDLIFNKSQSAETNEVINHYYLEGESNSANYLPKFNKINIIIGANNSGKSRFMRYLMSYNKFLGINELDRLKETIHEYNYKIDELNEIIHSKAKDFNYKADNTFYVDGINSDRSLAEKLFSNSLSKLSLEYSKDIISIIRKNKDKLTYLDRFGVKNEDISDFSQIEGEFFKEYDKIKRYYIPTLRTAHSLFDKKLELDNYKKIEDDIFLTTLDKNYNLNFDVEVFTGIHLYKHILNARNDKKSIRKRFEDFETFIGKNFFNSKQIDIVAEFNKDENLKNNNHLEIISVHIEGEKETRKLYELGDGIQALIILMYKIFMADENSFIFIDEPELNLHPGMQRLFLEQITNNKDLEKKNLTYIITTHSNHFLDLTLEKENVSIYSFSPKKSDDGENQFVIKNVNAGDNEILKTLGVNNSSVFMANCSIWVEGISDRNYIKAFLKSYCDSEKGKAYPKEDIDFAFFEYAGSNYTHYNFSEEEETEKIKAFALNNKILFLSDVDEGKNEKHQKLNEIAKNNFQYKTTGEFREIENLLTNEVWRKVLIEFRNKKNFKIDEDDFIQNKINKALDKTNYDDYKDKYIGVFLQKLKITELNKIWEGTDTKPQTFADKTYLSNLILEKVNNKSITWDDFKINPTIVELTEEIYNFIIQK